VPSRDQRVAVPPFRRSPVSSAQGQSGHCWVISPAVQSSHYRRRLFRSNCVDDSGCHAADGQSERYRDNSASTSVRISGRTYSLTGGMAFRALVCADATPFVPAAIAEVRERQRFVRGRMAGPCRILSVPACMSSHYSASGIADDWPDAHVIVANSHPTGCGCFVWLPPARSPGLRR